MNRLTLAVFGSLCLGTAAMGAVDTWHVDTAHSTAAFKVRHMTVSWVHGTLTGITGAAKFDDKDLKTFVTDVTIDAKTINTNNEKRDGHLKSADFFNTEKYPTMTFKSKKSTPGKGGTFKLLGDLTMAGTTKDVTFEGKDLTKAVKDPSGDTRRGFTATTKVNRKDFGVTWNKTLDGGGLVVGDEVDVTVDIELVLKTEKKI
jgi:polyisoprenoid-binding protein YceI